MERKWSGFEEEKTLLNSEQSDTFQQKTHLELSIRDLKEEVDGERSNRVSDNESCCELYQAKYLLRYFSAKPKMIYKISML